MSQYNEPSEAGFGTETSGTPVQWGPPQDHAACNDAIAAARALGAREALLALAAHFDTLADGMHTESLISCYRAAARSARERAEEETP
jgi:replication-associated recombination protein RarA